VAVLPVAGTAGVDWRTGAVEESTTEDLERGPEMKAKIREVSMKTTATPVVILPKKVVAPELPKIVWLDPPKAAPMLAPLPVWSKTIRISPMQTITWMITINRVMVYFILS
jgi:hypothetical protein